jgi:hypothetical protein
VSFIKCTYNDHVVIKHSKRLRKGNAFSFSCLKGDTNLAKPVKGGSLAPLKKRQSLDPHHHHCHLLLAAYRSKKLLHILSTINLSSSLISDAHIVISIVPSTYNGNQRRSYYLHNGAEPR